MLLGPATISETNAGPDTLLTSRESRGKWHAILEMGSHTNVNPILSRQSMAVRLILALMPPI